MSKYSRRNKDLRNQYLQRIFNNKAAGWIYVKPFSCFQETSPSEHTNARTKESNFKIYSS